jgi:hypothetical protein
MLMCATCQGAIGRHLQNLVIHDERATIGIRRTKVGLTQHASDCEPIYTLPFCTISRTALAT